MHKILILASVILISSASAPYPSILQQQIGNSCNQNPVFSITTFSVSPWPVNAGQQATISFSGTFNQGATVNQIQTGFYANQQWKYQDSGVGQSFSAGQAWSFSYNVNIPSNSGNYVVQVTLDQQSPQQYLACWQFTFSI